MIRSISLVLVVALVGAGLATTRALWEGRSALADGEKARERNDAAGAITGYRQAARWYVPRAPHVRRAYDRLEAIARAAEAEGETSTALAAWRGVRSSILATRSIHVPFEDRLELANRHIARLMAGVEGESVDPGASEAARQAWHYERLARIDAPSVGWVLVALVGLLSWIAGGVVFAARGVTAEDTLAFRPALAAGVLFTLGIVLWLAGLANA